MKTSLTNSNDFEQKVELEWLEGLNMDEYLRTAFPPDDFPTFYSPGEFAEKELLRYFSILLKDHDPMQNPQKEPKKEVTITDLIIEFHRLYADYKRPEYLEIAGILGTIKAP